jgi:hypothetical protein
MHENKGIKTVQQFNKTDATDKEDGFNKHMYN